MGHSYCQVFIHGTFSTIERHNLIPTAKIEELHRYLGGIARNHGIELVIAGGIENHVHVLIVLPPSMTVGKLMQTFKANSSRWLGEFVEKFAWQEGYGAFSVSPSQVPVVKEYIANQREHHKVHTFESEFLSLLKKSGTVDLTYALG